MQSTGRDGSSHSLQLLLSAGRRSAGCKPRSVRRQKKGRVGGVRLRPIIQDFGMTLAEFRHRSEFRLRNDQRRRLGGRTRRTSVDDGTLRPVIGIRSRDALRIVYRDDVLLPCCTKERFGRPRRIWSTSLPLSPRIASRPAMPRLGGLCLATSADRFDAITGAAQLLTWPTAGSSASARLARPIEQLMDF